MSSFILAVKKRVVGQQSLLTAIRKKSRVAAVIYGLGTEPLNIDTDYNQLLKVLKGAGTSHLIDLKLESQTIMVIVRDYQQDPVTDKLLHVDFLAVSPDKPFITNVPIELLGVSRAVKEQGAKLSIKNQWVKIKCLPANLPTKYVIDLSTLSEIGQGVQIGDIEAGPGVQVLSNPKDPVVSVVIPKQIILEEAPATTVTTETATVAETEGAVPAEGAEATKDKKAEGVNPADPKKI